MAHPDYLRQKARQLRLERKPTLDELVERLALPRTTIYYWIADIPIPPTTRQSERQRLGNEAMQKKYRLLRERSYEEGRAEFAELVREPGFRDFVCMYIGEGYKRDRNRVSLANSDPTVVSLAAHWIRRLTTNPFWCSVQHHADQDVEALRAFWASSLAVAPETIAFQRKSNSNNLNGRQWRCEHGVMTVGSNDTRLRARLEAWMDCVKREWGRLDSLPSGV